MTVAGGSKSRNTVSYGFLEQSQRTGHPTGPGDGCGEAEIMSGFPMSPGDGHPIITADGPMLPASDGFGYHRGAAKCTGGRDMLAGSGLVITSPGCRWHREKCTTVTATTDRTAWT